MKAKRILFVIPKIYANYPGALFPHVGIASLTSFLQREGIAVEILDMQLNYSFDYLLKRVKLFNPDLIGVTMFTYDFVNTYKLIDKLKVETKLPVIVGGVHVSSTHKDVMEKTKADYAIYGEGEHALLELVQGKKPKDIQNLLYRSGKKIIENSRRQPIWDMDSLPFPAFDAFDLKKYTYCSVDKRMPISTSRGCPFGCTFCAVKLSLGQNFRPRSPEKVIEELQVWYDKGYHTFEMVDDCFSFDLNRAEKICELIIKSGMKISWLCAGIRADKANYKLLKKMKKSGCTYMAFGLESGDPETLIKIKKGVTLENAINTFNAARKVGIACSVNFIIGHPFETFEKAMRSINFARKLPVGYVNFRNMIPYPGTEVYEYVKEFGTFIYPPEVYLSETANLTSRPVFETPEFTVAERKKAEDIAFALTRKMHLKFRFGKVTGSVLWVLFARDEKRYEQVKSVMMGTKVGREVFKIMRTK
ncbi:B12-binding domain-containing radical SAM protein [Candidatus Woesearchaeota archaeon]|nr:B12-binding domain-containing radical SAM protein [Candidatus Woesearchaeota archaeon]MBT4248416.1 B12-binding domain-containing radical SAM protein [Candidatus Woesearchaeota archaeon]